MSQGRSGEARLTEPPQLSAEWVVETDALCRRCGYNLRGLPLDGRCPECATPVGLSLRGDLIRFSDPRWSARVVGGLAVVFWASIVMVGLSVLTYCLRRWGPDNLALAVVLFAAW